MSSAPWCLPAVSGDSDMSVMYFPGGPGVKTHASNAGLIPGWEN